MLFKLMPTLKNIACVYLIENTINCKKYIGQSINYVQRKRSHKSNHVKKDYHLYLAMRKYGYENFEYTILMKDNTINYKDLDFWERYFINLFDTMNNKKGYNKENGGNLNKICSEEKKEKIKKKKC